MLRTPLVRAARGVPISRVSRLQHRCFSHSAGAYNNKLTGHKYDEAELMSSRLNKEPYYAKRPASERSVDDFYEQPQDGQEEGPSSEAELKRYQRIEVIKGIVAGIFTLGGIIGGYALWTEWPAIRAWYYQDGDSTDLPKRKKKKLTFELPVITNKNGSDVPGLYVWGDNANYIASPAMKTGEVRHPMRHAWFDGKHLRAVVLGETSALAIDDRGDLIQWGKGFDGTTEPKYSVKGEGLSMAKFSNGIIYALNKNNEILVIPENSEKQKTLPGLKSRNWLFVKTDKPFTKLNTSRLDKNEHFVSLDCGKDHLIALTNQGRAFTSSTGFQTPTKSNGQFGILDFSHFAKPPQPNKLYEIELLNKHIQRTAKGRIDHIEPRNIVKVVCGNYHTLALDSNGEVYSFGQNTYGQLAHPVSYETEFVAVPKKVELFAKHIRRDMFPEVLDIQAGGDTSFAIVKPVHMYQLIKGTAEDRNRMNDEEAFTVGFGKDLKGQIGNNLFIHAQFTPVKIRELAKYEDFNTETNEMQRVGIQEWSSGQEHTFIKMENKDVLYWGANDFAQLGNGKRNRIPKPTPPPAIIEPEFTTATYKDLTFANRLQLQENQHIVAGENNSAIYYTK